MNKKLLLPFLFLFSTSIAFAASQGQEGRQQEQRAQGLKFEDIKIACQNPAKFHNQAAPTNIQISCADMQYKWVIDSEGALPMKNSRLVTTSLYSDKYTVSPMTQAVPSASQVVTCPQFKEVVETVEVMQSVTCDDLIAYSGTGIDFCTDAINALRVANQQAVNVKDTGKVLSLCESKGQHQGRN